MFFQYVQDQNLQPKCSPEGRKPDSKTKECSTMFDPKPSQILDYKQSFPATWTVIGWHPKDPDDQFAVSLQVSNDNVLLQCHCPH